MLGDGPQMRSSLALTVWLMARYHVPLADVIGHNESLSSPLHKELYAPWRCQTHADWQRADMNVYRAKLRRLVSRSTTQVRLVHVPRYLIVRSFEVGEDQMPPVGRRSRSLTEEQFPEIIWEHSHVVVGEDGPPKSFCIYDAPSDRRVREHSKQLGDHFIENLRDRRRRLAGRFPA